MNLTFSLLVTEQQFSGGRKNCDFPELKREGVEISVRSETCSDSSALNDSSREKYTEWQPKHLTDIDTIAPHRILCTKYKSL